MNRRIFMAGAIASCVLPNLGRASDHDCVDLHFGEKKCRPYPPPNPSDVQVFACQFDPEGGNMFGGGVRISGCPVENARGDPYYNYMDEIIERDGSRRDRWVLVSERGSQNAGAGVCRARDGSMAKIVMWDPDYLRTLAQKAKLPRRQEQAAGLAVLFHEVGHHRNDDSLSLVQGEARRWQELYADYYAGREMARLNWPRGISTVVFGLMGSGGHTHPPARQRIQAAKTGWDNYHKKRYQSMQQFQKLFPW